MTKSLRAARPAVSALLPLVPRHDAFGRHLLLLLRKLLVAPSRSGRALGAHAYCALLSQRLLPDEAAQHDAVIALRAAAVQGMSRASSAILFQYNHPTTLEWGEDGGMPRLKNFGPRSLITRACQGFLQRVAFPMQFEFLFSFPRKTLDPQVFNTPYGLGDAERDLFVGGKKGMTMKDWFERYW